MNEKENILYYGDNLDILKRYIKDESVDLVYLDPPFKSDQDYNILFAEQNGTRSQAQIKAFEDTWRWDQEAALAYQDIIEKGPERISKLMQAFRTFLGPCDLLAYLAMMGPRLVELHRVLKPTGSIYLHCDPTAGHYLKLMLDAIFGARLFKNELIWKRTSAHSDPKRWGRIHDIILFYTKSDKYYWNPVFVEYDETYRKRFKNVDPDGRRWADYDLSAKGLSGGGYTYEYKGVTSLWRVPLERMRQLDREGRLHFTKKGGIRLKRYLDEQRGVAVQDVIVDIPPINSQAQERLGYPTQKPESLLQRILEASSKEKDVVLDPFCGCGTTISVAQRLKRNWIGIDITHLAITLIKHRLQDTFGKRAKYKVIGEPVSVTDAKALAKQDRYQFQWWALGLVGARPAEQKRGADKGIDGRLYFHDEGRSGKTKQIVLSVKSGGSGVSHVRDLVGVLNRENAAIGVLITMQEPTKPMITEATSAGFYDSPGWHKRYSRLQILTVEEILNGKNINYPATSSVTYNKAPKTGRVSENLGLFPD